VSQFEIQGEVGLRKYSFRLFQRTRPGGSTGELFESREIEAPGLAQAIEIARRAGLHEINFQSKFALIEGESGFVTCWMSADDL
jgi:hypothetical protein